MRKNVFLFIALNLCLTARATYAEPHSSGNVRRDEVVLAVATRSLTVGELEDHLAAIPRFQLRGFGATPDAIRRTFLAEVVIPDILLSVGATSRRLADSPGVASKLRRARSNATLREVRKTLGGPSDLSQADVEKYYGEHLDLYESPERINIWRILCRTRSEAEEVLNSAKKEGTPAQFNALARDHSLDKSTYLRGGNLGFLRDDGRSNEAGLRVDPVIVKAVAHIKDGEFAPTPIQEGENFAVVWRRGSVSAKHHALPEVAAQIRDALFKQRVESADRSLLDALRARDVRELNDSPLLELRLPKEDTAFKGNGH